MAYHIVPERRRHAGSSHGAMIPLIAALIGAVMVFSLSDFSTPSSPDADSAGATAPEDWHGNVRRSYWPD